MVSGQTIAGKYRLSRQLGSGGMASVWSATNVFTERKFAIKFMLPQVARTPEAAHRFLIEAKVSARINHPNIIEVIDVGQAEDGSLFLVMELLTGVSLEVGIRRQRPPMSLHEFLSVMRDVANALAAAHANGVIHRDLKPTNIFLHQDRDGRVVPKILDFGVSKILEEQSTQLTIDGTILGSPHYMSPEQAMGSSGLDGRTDVFAFGGILFEALVGRRAYEAPNFNALIVTIATKQPHNIDELAPQLPESVRSLVRDCLITDREARPASFETIAERIGKMLPDLEHSDLHLPGVASVEPPVTMQIATLPPSSARPAEATLAGLSGLQAIGTFVRTLPPRTLVLGGSAFVLLVVAGVAAVTRGGDAAPVVHASVPQAATTATPAEPHVALSPLPTAAPTAAAASAVPVISVDSLPVVSRTAARGSGKLSITSTPASCSIVVDGVARGVTPTHGIEVAAGAHRVECLPATGKAHAATLTVSEGGTTRHTFTLED